MSQDFWLGLAVGGCIVASLHSLLIGSILGRLVKLGEDFLTEWKEKDRFHAFR